MKNIKIILLILAVLSISLSGEVSAQQPCENATQYLGDNGFIKQPYTIWSQGPTHYANESFVVVKLVIPIDERYPRTGTEKTYFIGCETGRVFDHKPSTGEIMGVPVPERIDESLFIKMKTGSTDTEYAIVIITKEYLNQSQIDQLNQTLVKLNAVVPLIFSNVTLDQFDAISNFNWARLPLNRRAEFEESDKITVTIQSNPEFFTEERYNQVIQTGAEIYLADRYSIVQYIHVTATPSQIEKIAEFEWVYLINENIPSIAFEPDKKTETKYPYYIVSILGILAILSLILKIKRNGGRRDE